MNQNSVAWAPVVAAAIVGGAAFLGNVLSFVGVWIVQWKTGQREREARHREAQDKRLHHWNEFQLRTLIELQEAARSLVQFPALFSVRIDAQTNRTLGTSSKEYATVVADLIIKMLEDRTRVDMLAARIPDVHLSELVTRIGNLADRAAHAGTDSEAIEAEADQMTEAFGEFNARVRELISPLRPAG